MNDLYRPIACALHSELEQAILRQRILVIETDEGEILRGWRGEDILIHDRAEYLRLRSSAGAERELRLDRLRRVIDEATGRVLIDADWDS